MADDLTADDLRKAAGARIYESLADLQQVYARAIAAADLMDQGWHLTPPPQPGVTPVSFTDDQLDALDALLSLVHYDDTALRFLEMLPERLRYSRRVPAPPPQPGTVTELDLIVFLEWLDSTRQVTEWGDPNATHEDTAREYLAQAPPSGNVTVNADDLRALLRPYDATRAAVMNAVNNVASALAEVDRDH